MIQTTDQLNSAAPARVPHGCAWVKPQYSSFVSPQLSCRSLDINTSRRDVDGLLKMTSRSTRTPGADWEEGVPSRITSHESWTSQVGGMISC